MEQVPHDSVQPFEPHGAAVHPEQASTQAPASHPLAQATSSLGGVALIAVSTYYVIGNTITLGTMMMFFVFRTFFVERLNHCVSYLMELRRVQTHAERIHEVMKDEPGSDEEALRLSFSGPFVVPPEHGVLLSFATAFAPVQPLRLPTASLARKAK